MKKVKMDEPAPLYPSILPAPPEGLPLLPIPTRFTERHLQAAWYEQKYFRPLVTTKGEAIEVLSPGIWNAEAGPDFRRAHLRIGDREVRGDVELHLRAGDWRHHRHHLDSRYDDVVLHVVLWGASLSPPLTARGDALPEVVLESRLTVSTASLCRLIDLDLYPYETFVGSGRCASLLFSKLDQKKSEKLLASAAYWRLEQKALSLREAAPQPSLCAAMGMAMALGYKSNTSLFSSLFSWLWERRHQGKDTLFALALVRCGLFADPMAARWGEEPEYNRLKLLVEKESDGESHSRGAVAGAPLILAQVRPANHPLRRLWALASLVADPHTPLLDSRVTAFWQEHWPSCQNPRSARKSYKGLIALLPEYHDDFWTYHYTFLASTKGKAVAVVGEELRGKAVVNAVLPLLYEEVLGRGDAKELAAFFDLLSVVKAPPSGKARYLQYRFFGDSRRGDSLKDAFMQQGAYQIHRDFCLHYEASCHGCPFVERAWHAVST